MRQLRRRDKSVFANAAPSAPTLMMQAVAARAFRASATIRRKAINAGQVADYIDWQQRVWDDHVRLVGRRERLWEQLAERLDGSRPVLALEFGVAWGYATNWWLERLQGRDVVWHGFDRFTGLPRSWRDHDVGAFDAGGNPPAIRDERVRWHIGDVQTTLPLVELAVARDRQWLVLFDLDIYEPTAFAWEAIGPHLQPGDLLYFDEAMDADERRVLNESVLPTVSCEPVGATSLALGLAVTAQR